MFTLKGRQDGFRFLLPKEFIPEEINEKYTKILTDAQSYLVNPIDFINETIQKVDVLGFNGGTIIQNQPGRGEPMINPNRIKENNFMHSGSDVAYRSASNPLNLVDKTLNIDFRHTLGYLNYFIILESFYHQYSRDKAYKDIQQRFNIDLFNERGGIYASIVLNHPLIDGMDMLSFDYTKPTAQSQTFRVIFKYSNFDYVLLPGSEDED